jgi:hypothetical protein
VISAISSVSRLAVHNANDSVGLSVSSQLSNPSFPCADRFPCEYVTRSGTRSFQAQYRLLMELPTPAPLPKKNPRLRLAIA